MTAMSRARKRVGLVVVGPAGERVAATADQALDLAGDPLGLLLLVVGLEALDLQRRRAFSVQSFLSLRALLRETTAWAASRISWVER